MASNDDVHRDLYDKVNETAKSVAGFASEVRVNNERFEEILALLERDMKNRHREVMGLILFAFFLVAIIGYGAIGKDGLYTVRSTIPAIANGQTGVLDDSRRSK